MRRSVLLIEDEESIRELVTDYFTQSAWQVIEAANGEEALELFNACPPDLVIVDLMIPKVSGWNVCRQIRSQSTVPIIILTAKSEEENKLLGFELGADDYVTKPFSPRVLVARAETLMKRVDNTVGQEDPIISFGNIKVYERKRVVESDGQPVELSYKEYDVLLHLLRHRNFPLTREHLLNQVWGVDYFGDPRVVDTHIKNLRKKLGEDAGYIRTVFRIGYKFEVES
ncbi:response regulator transcription factor [Paenibacillus polysaccharolyticus]|uniref:Response regulator transcription factor n=1 Tax=Paenibacillus cucumis (ex Kampfer et al. 2016) TaxID=1776858 RepID=A0ABS7KE45_9BACL|nr:response regulator transcription factor [Paenibacillus cucumis (ex Kampfer et al. 2016)]MBY0202356.1 response regulator transcription factor [Paenibacillus cucumis (ex Kampfer et al. 2016)]MCP1135209.1 response regulator transcription factor [Paenibacillus polysaccharolyticus]